MVVVTTSAAANFDLRAAQRDAMPEEDLQEAGIRRVFLLARSVL